MLTSLLASLWLLVGSYQPADKEGITLYEFNEETLSFSYVNGVKGISNPSFFTLDKDKTHIYAVGEDDGLTSTANTISLNITDGSMKLECSQLTQGGAPCNICLSPDEKMLFTSNYMGGSISTFKVKKDGKLGKAFTHQFTGSSINKDRQNKPHIHAANFTPDGKWLLVNDLGTDNIHMFPVKNKGRNCSVDWHHGQDVSIKAGAGPRHLCFAPDGKHAYLVCELSDEIYTLEYNGNELKVLQCIKGLDNGASGSADIHISSDGKFVYASHRLKDDGISISKVQEDGTLVMIGYIKTGLHPRNFVITPDGEYILVACKDSNKIQVLKRDSKTGQLTDTNKYLTTPSPVCVKFF